MAWPTAQDVVTQAAIELGLQPSLVVSDPFSSLDPNILQLVAFLNRGGMELVDEADWSHLRQQFAFQSVSGLQQYALPDDWRDMVDQSGWNRSSRLPIQPLSAQQWSYLAARNTGIVFNVLFRPMQGYLWLYPPNSTSALNLIISMEYKSSWWVRSATTSISTLTVSAPYNAGTLARYGGWLFRCVYSGVVSDDLSEFTTAAVSTGLIVNPAVGGAQWNYLGTQSTVRSFYPYGSGDTVQAGSDAVMFDKSLLVAKLRLLFLQAKGLDWSQAERDYKNTFERVLGNDVASPVLSLGGAAPVLDPLLGIQNYPITGFGT